MSESFTEVGGGITLCHESFGERSDPPLLLVMGLGTQMIAWHDEFCSRLAERGFHVVRFDNRDSGRSSRVDLRPPRLHELFLRRLRAEQYTIDDMARDTAGLIEALELGAVHLVGASMGGMIAQNTAAERPDLVRSLVSIMSNTGAFWSGQPELEMYRHLLKTAPREREAYAEQMAAMFELIGSPDYPTDRADILDQARRSFDRAHDRAGVGRQLGAIVKSGNRTDKLRAIKAPTLVIHGTKDRLVRPSGGRATAEAIPGARLEMIEGMGHDLPRALWPRFIDLIAENAARAESAAVAGAARG